ncbi:DUF1330 domain-containing protein [Desulfogranum marinum]|uniref:DUF1330 domain-containing protein n=1 Tax=Desulfogranum marinum TaxID=453220 RepID=UPI0029C81222|nr:DUF1330 domain-containing protein [Desulfogranum marinum]
MATYFVGNFRITDAEGMAKYREKVAPLLLKEGCEFLVINDDVEVVEGREDHLLLA